MDLLIERCDVLSSKVYRNTSKPLKSAGASQFIQDGNGNNVLFTIAQAKRKAFKLKRIECNKCFVKDKGSHLVWSAC